MQALREGQKKIDDAITAAQQAVTKKLAESGAAMLKATKLAVEVREIWKNIEKIKNCFFAEFQRRCECGGPEDGGNCGNPKGTARNFEHSEFEAGGREEPGDHRRVHCQQD